jgi:aminoglycoside phosphotransferase (APT) family kinase protein
MSGATDLSGQLAASLSEVLGPIEVHGLRRLTGGASRETWSFDAVLADGVRHELVLRRDPPSRPGPSGAMQREAQVIRVAGAAGVPVPEVLADSSDPSVWGAAGLVMRRVGGEALGKRILRSEDLADARAVLVEQCAAALASLHAADPVALEGAPEPEPLEMLRTALDVLGEPVPTFEYALRWLDRHRPEPTGRAIVHGDFRLGNLLVGPDGLQAVLDWELVHLGDPVEDLGWLCVRAWRFGAAAPVAGLGTREELLEAYVRAGGARVDPAVLRWWEVYGTLRWGVICLTQTAVHLRGDLRSVELAAIGRRVCETEWDLLLLIAPEVASAAPADGPDDAAPVDTAAEARAGLHGRPTAVELVESVREFLTDQVMPATEGSTSYHARVAANVLAMVGRELVAGARPQQRRTLQLTRLGVHSEEELCSAIRAGGLDDVDELITTLAEGVVERVRVANPNYLVDLALVASHNVADDAAIGLDHQ